MAPSLKVTVRTEARDWRAHLDQIHQHRDTIAACMATASLDLGRWGQEARGGS